MTAYVRCRHPSKFFTSPMETTNALAGSGPMPGTWVSLLLRSLLRCHRRIMSSWPNCGRPVGLRGAAVSISTVSSRRAPSLPSRREFALYLCGLSTGSGRGHVASTCPDGLQTPQRSYRIRSTFEHNIFSARSPKVPTRAHQGHLSNIHIKSQSV